MLLVLLALALAADQPPAPAPRTAKPELRLMVRPEQAIWRHGAVYVRALVRLEDPHRELACPEIEIQWGDGCRSAARSWSRACDPFGLPAPALHRWEPRMHAYREPGEFSIVACVIDVLGRCRRGLRVRRTVRIIGPGDPGSPEQWARR